MSSNSLIFFREFHRDIRVRSLTFQGLYCGKACNRKLFCIKTGFSMVKSMESFYFSHTILWKGMTFHRIILGKSNLPRIILQKSMPFRRSKLSANYPAESFIILWKVKMSLFKGLSLLLQIILDKKSTMGNQYYPRFFKKKLILT